MAIFNSYVKLPEGKYSHKWLVVLTIMKNMSSSMGRIIPNIWKNKSHVPNHQPAINDWKNIPL